MKKIIFIFLAFSILLNFSCSTDETCIQTKYVKMTVNFYLANPTDTIIANRIKAMTVDTLTVQGLRFDSITGLYQLVDSILYNKENKSTIDLPLNNNSTRSTFRLKFKNVTDTMTILHSNLKDYLSLECGCIIIHAIDTVITTNHYIDSARIRIHDVNTINAENIRLYFDTARINNNKVKAINAKNIRFHK